MCAKALMEMANERSKGRWAYVRVSAGGQVKRAMNTGSYERKASHQKDYVRVFILVVIAYNFLCVWSKKPRRAYMHIIVIVIVIIVYIPDSIMLTSCKLLR